MYTYKIPTCLDACYLQYSSFFFAKFVANLPVKRSSLVKSQIGLKTREETRNQQTSSAEAGFVEYKNLPVNTRCRSQTSDRNTKMAATIARRSFSANIKRFISNLQTQRTTKPSQNISYRSDHHARAFTSFTNLQDPLYSRNVGLSSQLNAPFRRLSLSVRRAGQGRSLEKCWKCGEGTQDLFFCGSCGVIQPARDVDYFEVLGFPVKFDLDPAQLTQQFRQLQRKLHPDKFTQKSQVGPISQNTAHSNQNFAFLFFPPLRLGR